MKHIQGTSVTGYVTISIKGNKPELFFQACVDQGIPVWNVKKEEAALCKGNIKLSDIKYVRKIKRGTHYKLSFTSQRGYPFLFKRFTRKKELLFGLMMGFLLIIFLSNIIWKVEVSGVPTDIEEKITKQLNSYGIHPGAWVFSLDPPSVIQQKLEKDIPELLWIGVHKKGTTYSLEGVEKIIVEEKEVEGPRNLVASKKAVIKSIYVSKGIPKVNVYDYVEPGDVLVSGEINFEEEKQEDEDKENRKDHKGELIAAEGEVIAKTWYETKVTIPLKGNFEMLTGEKEKKYYLKFGNMNIPVWGFGSPDYEKIHRETLEKPLYFLKWKLPFKFVETILSEKRYNKLDRNKKEATNLGIQQAKKELQLRLGPDAEIISEKILHERVENGKVKLILYITVEEDIAKTESISQGD